MRIVINQKKPPDHKHKTKFFKMAVLFAEEYNKYVPEEERAKIVIPYSLLLSKGNLLFPESLEAELKSGQPRGNFLNLLQQHPDLFEFVFTDGDKALYKDVYDKADALVRTYDGNGREAAVATGNGISRLPSVLDANMLRELQSHATHINTLLALSGQNLDTWFSDKNLGAGFPLLLPESDNAEAVSGPGLFIAMLRREETRKHLKPPSSLPPITQENHALYEDLVAKAATLVERINEETLARQAKSTADAEIRKMRGSKEKAPLRHDEISRVTEESKRYGTSLDRIDQQWLEGQGVCTKNHVLQLDNLSAGLLLESLVSFDGTRKKCMKDTAIETHAEEEMNKLVIAHDAEKEPIIYAVDDSEFHKRVTGFTKIIELEDGRAIKNRTITNPLAVKGEEEFARLDIVPSKKLYDTFKERLSRFKDDAHPERNESIDKALNDMHNAILESGMATAPRKIGSVDKEVDSRHLPGGFLSELLETRSPGANPVDPTAITGAYEQVSALLEANGLPKSLRAALKTARDIAERQILPVSGAGEGKVAPRK